MDMRSVPWVFLSITFHLLLFLFSLLFIMTDGDSVTINNLRDSANGTFVTLDGCMPDTGYEPNVMELTDVMKFAGTTELNDAASSDIYFQDSLDYTAPSSDLYIDDDELGKLLAEAHREYADYRIPEGVSVSQSSLSVLFDRTGKPVGERMSTNQLMLVSRETRTVLTASFLKSPKLRKLSIERNLWEKAAQMHSLGPCLMNIDRWLSQNTARKLVFTNFKQLEPKKNAEFYKKNYGVSKRIFIKFHQQSLTEMEELRKFQSSTFDTLTRQKFIEDQNTILELSGRVQFL